MNYSTNQMNIHFIAVFTEFYFVKQKPVGKSLSFYTFTPIAKLP